MTNTVEFELFLSFFVSAAAQCWHLVSSHHPIKRLHSSQCWSQSSSALVGGQFITWQRLETTNLEKKNFAGVKVMHSFSERPEENRKRRRLWARIRKRSGSAQTTTTKSSSTRLAINHCLKFWSRKVRRLEKKEFRNHCCLESLNQPQDQQLKPVVGIPLLAAGVPTSLSWVWIQTSRCPLILRSEMWLKNWAI